MTDSSEILAANDASTARLEALTAALSQADLQRSLGGGWNVAIALTHLAFWDFRQVAALKHFVETGDAPEDDRTVNPALEATAKGMDPEMAAWLAVESARAVDTVVRALSADAFAALDAGEHAYLVRRSAHREEHIAQIEAALT